MEDEYMRRINKLEPGRCTTPSHTTHTTTVTHLAVSEASSKELHPRNPEHEDENGTHDGDGAHLNQRQQDIACHLCGRGAGGCAWDSIRRGPEGRQLQQW